MIVDRRTFLRSLLAAPVIVRPGILMPVRPVVCDFDAAINRLIDIANERFSDTLNQAVIDCLLYGRAFVHVSCPDGQSLASRIDPMLVAMADAPS